MYTRDCVYYYRARWKQQQKNNNKISARRCRGHVDGPTIFDGGFLLRASSKTRFHILSLSLSVPPQPGFKFHSRMAADSDGNDLTAVVICEGDYHDPTFPQKLNNLVARLNSLIDEQPKSKRLKVNKVSL